MFQILVTEDDEQLRGLMSRILKKKGYNVCEASNGKEALAYLDTLHIDLIISDIMMPEMDGYELTKELREAGYDLPILMVTARDTFLDKEKGFLVGTDDYMVKPIDMNEMVLRVGALLRRSHIAAERRLEIGKTVLSYDALTVKCAEEEQLLPQKEFYLLFKLLSSPGKIFTRAQIMDEIWGLENDSDQRTVDVHINRLRERFKENDDFDIVTVRGLGYKAVKKDVSG